MRIRCGVDIIYIPKIEKIIKDEKKLSKFVDLSELGNGTAEHIAGIIAAKEAFFKALGLVPKFRDIIINHENSGKPTLNVSPIFQEFVTIDVSISHDKDYAIGFVVLELPK